MKTLIISYSLTGNNKALATSVAEAIGAEHITLTENTPRTKITIMVDLLLNRTPEVKPAIDNLKDYDLVIFMGPVWMGQVATPLRAYFNQFRSCKGEYVFISISGGSDEGNPNLADDIIKRVGKDPAALIDLHITDLMPAEPKPDRKTISAYRLTEKDIKNMTDTILGILEKIPSLNSVKTFNVS
jgi:flavodoxin